MPKSTNARGATLFVGGGSIAAAMISGLTVGKYASPIIVHDRRAERMRLLRRKFQTVSEPDLANAVADAEFIVLAVRPDAAPEMLCDLARALQSAKDKPKKIVVSVIAGLPLALLRKQIPARVDWVRAMPSPLSESGNGLTALAFARSCSSRSRRSVKRFFSEFGQVLEVPESEFNAFTVVYSPSHGLHALSALSEAAVRGGLNKHAALVAAAHALGAAEAVLKQRNADIENMVRQAATPGGTAEATMAAMDAAGYGDVVAKGVQAGIARARSMADRTAKQR